MAAVRSGGAFGRSFALFVFAAALQSSCNASATTPALSIPHPGDEARQVEYYLEKPAGEGPWPTVVFLHGHQNAPRRGAREFAEWGVLAQFAKRGYLAVAISQPGYGGSTGPADFCGPLTQQAVSGVIGHLRKTRLASPTKVVIQGVSRGAVVAALLAESDLSIAGVVLISGIYDVPAYVAAVGTTARSEIIASITAETGGSAQALQARSTLHALDRFGARALILSGAKDDRADPEQARRLATELNRRGKQAKVVVYPQYGHQIPVEVRNKEIDPFIDQVLGTS
jgi:dipeptidyl aminopeptidase/acylaminoacyl peptidase